LNVLEHLLLAKFNLHLLMFYFRYAITLPLFAAFEAGLMCASLTFLVKLRKENVNRLARNLPIQPNPEQQTQPTPNRLSQPRSTQPIHPNAGQSSRSSSTRLNQINPVRPSRTSSPRPNQVQPRTTQQN